MRYEYVNDTTGERLEIDAPMRSPPPEWVKFTAIGRGWVPAENNGSDSALVFRRDYSNAATAQVIVKDHRVGYKIPASRSLPRRKGGKLDKLHGEDVKRHADGGYTTLDGKPLVMTKADAEREQKRTGLVRD